MTNKNNKGFSLIELIIAVAILSILLSPIIIQISQTLSTSSKAKERQYVVENANYVMEYFKKYDKTELGSDGTVSIQSYSTSSVACTAVSASLSTLGTINYNASIYVLDDKELGKKHTKYGRTVVLDDLSNNLLENKLIAKQDFTTSEEANLEASGYKKTSEGTYVKYDSVTSGTSSVNVIKSIVCETRTEEYENPNTASLGYIQNLDATKAAIIQGDASNMDSQVEKEFYGKKMDHLKEYNYSAWEAAMSSVTGENIFSSNVYGETMTKMTKLSITQGTDASTGLKYYDVSCDVYYEDAYTLYSHSITDKLKYNVYGQRFYTNKAPDIFFVYEPFVTVSSTNIVTYARHDYITTYCDAGSSESKIYLIKPDESQFLAKGLTEPSTGEYAGIKAYWTKYNGSYTPVTLHINNINATGVPELKIFTNLTISSENVNSMFDVTAVSAVQSMELPSEGTVRNAYDSGDIQNMDADTRTAERLYTITVSLSSGDGNITTFTGSKGEN